jgi:hypothetical protein
MTQSFSKTMNGAKGKLGEKNRCGTFVVTANFTLSPCIGPKAKKGYNQI